MLTAYCFVAAANLLVVTRKIWITVKTSHLIFNRHFVGILLLFVAPAHDEFGLDDVNQRVVWRQLCCRAKTRTFMRSRSINHFTQHQYYQRKITINYFKTVFWHRCIFHQFPVKFFFSNPAESAQSNVAQTVGQLRRVKN